MMIRSGRSPSWPTSLTATQANGRQRAVTAAAVPAATVTAAVKCEAVMPSRAASGKQSHGDARAQSRQPPKLVAAARTERWKASRQLRGRSSGSRSRSGGRSGVRATRPPTPSLQAGGHVATSGARSDLRQRLWRLAASPRPLPPPPPLLPLPMPGTHAAELRMLASRPLPASGAQQRQCHGRGMA